MQKKARLATLDESLTTLLDSKSTRGEAVEVIQKNV